MGDCQTKFSHFSADQLSEHCTENACHLSKDECLDAYAQDCTSCLPTFDDCATCSEDCPDQCNNLAEEIATEDYCNDLECEANADCLLAAGDLLNFERQYAHTCLVAAADSFVEIENVQDAESCLGACEKYDECAFVEYSVDDELCVLMSNCASVPIVPAKSLYEPPRCC